MCYYVDQKSTRTEVKEMFNIAIDNADRFYQGTFVNGFENPNLPIITNDKTDIITTDSTWGLMPSWGKEKDILLRNSKLNARIETLDEKASYRNITSKRCLILSTGYYEWRWLDEKGKKKEKYNIFSQSEEIFGFAGLYDTWQNPLNGEVINSFTMVTTSANELMTYIHNHKMRMPIIIKKEDHLKWLDPTSDISDFAYPKYDTSIVAFEAA